MRQVVTDSGEAIDYDKLILCTGSSARGLPDSIGGNLRGVYCLRSIADIDDSRLRMTPASMSINW